MSNIIDPLKLEAFAAYAEKHGLYDMFQSVLSKLIIARPTDPFQFMIDHFSKSDGTYLVNNSP